MNKSVNGRKIRDLREKLKLSQTEFALKIGKSLRSIQMYEQDKTTPSGDTLLILLNLIDENTHDIAQTDEAKKVDFKELSVMYVPLVSKFAYAGYLGGFGDWEYVGDLPKIPFANGFRPKGNYLCFEVRGDSMTNDSRESIEEGDIILGREVGKQHWVNKLHINQWDFIIIHKEQGILLKRVAKHDTKTGNIVLQSLNDHFEDLIINLKDVAQIFNIVEITKKARR